MTLDLIDPQDLPTAPTYTQVIVASGSRMVFVAGQVAQDSDGNVVAPGDLAGQARQTFANVGRALAAAGARPNQVTKITTYIVGYSPEYRALVADPRAALFGDHRPASTLVGVEALARPDPAAVRMASASDWPTSGPPTADPMGSPTKFSAIEMANARPY